MWKTHRWLLIALILLTICRWIMAGAIELTEDESYYHLWSEHPALSYYSKGPGVAATMGVSSFILGDSAFGIRFFSPLLGLATSLLIFRLARSIFDTNTAAWSVVLLNILPIFNAGSILLTIDPLSIFFWTAAMLALWRALHRSNASFTWWPLTGLLIGLGFLCKYTNALQLISIILLLVIVRRWRPHWRKPGPYLLLATFLVCTLPVIIWNAQNQWITVTHLIERGQLDEETGVNPGEFFSYLGMHAGVYSPVIFLGLLAALYLGIKRVGKDFGETFLILFAAPIIILYFILSFKEAGEANWTAPGMLSLGVLMIHYFQLARWSNRTKGIVRATAITLSILLTALSLNLDVLRKMGVQWPYSLDPTTRLTGWQSTADAVEDVIRKSQDNLGDGIFLICDRYQSAASLHHHLPDDLNLIRPTEAHPKVFIPQSSIILNQFSFWPRYDSIAGATEGEPGYTPFLGKNALFISTHPRSNPPEEIRRAFRHTQPLSTVEIRRLGMKLRDVRIFVCYDYQGISL
ncbi:glycosyltransferase family 39 protein [Sulfuriroseicoccus oceanibius]|uniref:Glycosyltransferase family 39 protein n=1 Tax=Sulfuriroseicoccus oceanibius TaxID=2707525 RepID=A0A6B3LD94_9BACT|nr:glycosyltransferase family 39 protein [Sulfuriroseicoccus oceanibius]QQL44508.1 glycosyltransferase family 39 protein [Sulfuriroseicoccus oceanibius]